MLSLVGVSDGFGSHRLVRVPWYLGKYVDWRMSVYRSINQFVSQICVSVEFNSEGVEFGRRDRC